MHKQCPGVRRGQSVIKGVSEGQHSGPAKHVRFTGDPVFTVF